MRGFTEKEAELYRKSIKKTFSKSTGRRPFERREKVDMKKKELKEKMKGYPISVCIIETCDLAKGIRQAIAVYDVGRKDVRCFWRNGEQTQLPKQFKIIEWVWR